MSWWTNGRLPALWLRSATLVQDSVLALDDYASSRINKKFVRIFLLQTLIFFFASTLFIVDRWMKFPNIVHMLPITLILAESVTNQENLSRVSSEFSKMCF